ncbi:MAG: hypothetical protein AABZ73_03880 [Pseudomonadota bacterium]|uniref:hypothetical protein n=1 Tax=Sphingobium sp. TaxID=1912891 RepID=UPI002E206918
MRSHVEFRSAELNERDGAHPVKGRAVAELLAQSLPLYGSAAESIAAEDWGWRIIIANDPFPLWIGCGQYLEFDDGFLCFIEPSRPYVRRWFRKIFVFDAVERLASAMDQCLRRSSAITDIRWWDDEEVSAN